MKGHLPGNQGLLEMTASGRGSLGCLMHPPSLQIRPLRHGEVEWLALEAQLVCVWKRERTRTQAFRSRCPVLVLIQMSTFLIEEFHSPGSRQKAGDRTGFLKASLIF